MSDCDLLFHPTEFVLPNLDPTPWFLWKSKQKVCVCVCVCPLSTQASHWLPVFLGLSLWASASQQLSVTHPLRLQQLSVSLFPFYHCGHTAVVQTRVEDTSVKQSNKHPIRLVTLTLTLILTQCLTLSVHPFDTVNSGFSSQSPTCWCFIIYRLIVVTRC